LSVLGTDRKVCSTHQTKCDSARDGFHITLLPVPCVEEGRLEMYISRTLRRAVLAVFLVILGTSTAGAGVITYSTDLQVGGMSVPIVTGTTSPPPPGIGSASISLVPVSGAGPFDPGFAGVIVPFATQAVDTSAFAEILPAQADTLGTGLFSLFLKLTDMATTESATLQFVGSVGGSVFTAPAGGAIDRIQVVYTSLIPFPFNETRSVVIGGEQYDVTLQFDGLLLNSNQLIASADFKVQIVSAIPEPASALLLGVGALALVGWGYRRRLASVPS
jgi:hypothetical protein